MTTVLVPHPKDVRDMFEGILGRDVDKLDGFRSIAGMKIGVGSDGSGTARIAEDIAALLAVGDAKARAAVFDNGLATLRDIYAQGVTDSALAGRTAAPSAPSA